MTHEKNTLALMKGIENQHYSEYSIYQLRHMVFKPLFIQVYPIEIIDLFFKGDLKEVYLLQLLNCQENLSCFSWSYFYSKVDIQDILIGVFDCFWRFIDKLFTDDCRKLLSD